MRRVRTIRGTRLLRGGRGGKPSTPVPIIVLSASSVLETASVNTVIGVLAVANGSGSYTFTEAADPDSKFNISGANLRVDASLDYETKTSHSVTIQADNGVDPVLARAFTITVVDVSEAPAGDADFTTTFIEIGQH